MTIFDHHLLTVTSADVRQEDLSAIDALANDRWLWTDIAFLYGIEVVDMRTAAVGDSYISIKFYDTDGTIEANPRHYMRCPVGGSVSREWFFPFRCNTNKLAIEYMNPQAAPGPGHGGAALGSDQYIFVIVHFYRHVT